MRAYFAHPISHYDTDQERYDIEVIKQLGFTVCNPSSPKIQRECGHDMGKYLRVVDRSDCVIFRRFRDGKISAGVALEIDRATAKGKPVLELPSQTGNKYRYGRVETREKINRGEL